MAELLGKEVESIDKAMWNLIWEWECCHRGLYASRVSVIAVMNYSQSSVHIQSVDQTLGKNFKIFGPTEGYHSSSRRIKSGGS